MNAALIAFILGMAMAAQTAAPVVHQTWELSKLEGLEAAGWSAPQQISATGPATTQPIQRDCRSALAGRSAVLAVPIWWDKAKFRPTEGSVYSLKIAYQDTATQPVVASSHAGVAGYWGMSELHRFGGEGDGQWKTADVPISWDLICRKNGTDNKTEIAFSSNKDLPIESIQLVDAAAQDADKYYEQTRQWVAKAQASKRKDASLGPQEKPVIPEKFTGKVLVPYPCSWVQPLLPGAAPQAAQAGSAVKIRMARNEYETGAFAVYADGWPLRHVTYSLSPLKGDAGELKCELDLRTAEYTAVQETVDYGTDQDSGKYKLYPQHLYPQFAQDVPAGQSRLFWITLRTLGQATRAGKYAGLIRITGQADGDAGTTDASAELPIEVEVLPVMLPSVEEAGLALSNCTAGLPTLQELKTLAEHNHTGMDIWFGGTQPQFKVAGGKLAIDWTYMDDWMAGARKAGMTHMVWFFGGDPIGFPDTMNLERDLYSRQTDKGSDLRREFIKKTNERPEKVIDELRPLYVDFVRQTALHAKEKGWPRLILQPFDEPGKWKGTPRATDNRYEKVVGAGPWIKDHFKDGCGLIREGLKGLEGVDVKLALEAHVVEPCLVFLEDVDIFCTNRAYTLPGLGEKLRQAKVALWQYSNCDDQAPAHRTRYSFGFYQAAFDSRGSLVWAYNFMKRFDTSGRGNWGSAWYSPFGTIMAPSLVGLREGMDDRRWCEAAKKLSEKDPSIKALLEEIRKQALDSRAKTRYDSYNEVDEPAKLDQWRQRIQEAVVKAGGQ